MTVVKQEFYFDSSDGISSVYASIWENDAAAPQFILQLAHGMCEYIERYDDFARFICENGGVVYGNDHLGHGHTKAENGTFGYFAKKDGEQLVVEDIHRLSVIAKEQHPGVPLYLMGHSMGSLLARDDTVKHGAEIDGAIYMGTSGANSLTGVIRFLARVGIVFGRAKKPATLLSHLAFSKYNDRCDDVRTPNDWVTRDRDVVERYNNDAWCTFQFTDRAAYDFANLVDAVSGKQWAEKMPKTLPCLLLSGAMDPVGNYGEGVKEVYGWMKEAGLQVTMKLYEGARHELLNEINRQEVYGDVLEWIKAHG